ncbi:hypothetical protein L6452_35161 [Arctium lappa]|uniref:Uncharacterized protein n=1 Tax=Arctium lappa TaxID=4217 RepID=A0ACB8YL98_ARCLA|nr:hypothetical protein L6452_35161 [Arctium lappa]
MPRHLISDAHEWINEIPTVPCLLSSETTAKGTGLAESAGKEEPFRIRARSDACAPPPVCRPAVGPRPPRHVSLAKLVRRTSRAGRLEVQFPSSGG